MSSTVGPTAPIWPASGPGLPSRCRWCCHDPPRDNHATVPLSSALPQPVSGGAAMSRPESTLLVNGQVIDGLGGHAERSAVLVEGDTIAAVGSAAEAARRTAARVIDL